MNLETIKSFILVFLIFLSLMLTLAIWNYQPSYDNATNERSPIDATIEDGIEETKKSIIKPSQIVFHEAGNHYGLAQVNKEEDLYAVMQEWSLYDFEPISEEEDETTSENEVEVMFPTEIPAELIRDIFTVGEDEIISGRVFDRMKIILDENQTDSQLIFIQSRSNTKFSANIQNIAEVRQDFVDYKDNNELVDLLVFEGNNPIYLPDQMETNRISFTAKSISKPTLRNILWNNPSSVRSSEIVNGEEKFTDGQSEMVVYGNYMEYINPTSSENRIIEGRQLVNQTLEFVNDHKGWTTDVKDDYVLHDLNVQSKTAKYRLTYDGIPIFESDRLSTISVTLRNQSVYQYNRPLIQLGIILEGQKVDDLQSGQQVIAYLERSKKYERRFIEEIKLGYEIEESGIQYAFTLSPKWFIKINNSWEQLDFEDAEISMGGGNNAMGSS
ncbi:YycH family regulatory protein [Aquibacillus saliphilus]|uniref:YycH family regulatory protein n=1 Tax=Aquibacillus saliphilus TaxID=1909422 RepID=UPI001CEFED57|nr:two-component system activity regulator YycH [Aquibacillus saliphilus]